MPRRPVHEAALNPFERTPHELTRIALLAMVFGVTGTDAAELDAPMLSFSAFGTLGVVHSSEHQADFTSTSFKPNGAGFSHDWSADVDSLIAGQLTANFMPQLSAVLQVVSEQTYENTYRPYVEWANVKYQFTPDLSVRVGRTVLPIFMLSDSRKIGYSYAWVRPPVEVYSIVPVTSNDGVDASYRVSVGAATNTLQLTVGQSDSRFPNNAVLGAATAQARDVFAVADTVEGGFATVRINYGRASFTIPSFGPLFDAFRQFGAEGTAIADRYDVNGRLVTFLGVGASYDPGDWFVMGEWGRIDTRSALGSKTGWYVSGGYRLRNFTPYITYASVKSDGNTADPGLTVSALPPFLAGAAGNLNAALNSILSSKVFQNTISVGGRWDFTKNADLKLQFDHSRLGAGSPGTLINTQPDFVPGGRVNLFSATIDFVF